MKKLISLIMCAMMIVACENGDNNNLPNKPVEKRCYMGTMTVDQNDGTMYTQDDVEVDYELQDDGKLNFVMYNVKFATGMPLKLDMVVEGVSYYSKDGDVYTLSGDGIVPYAMGGPFEKFTITKLTGTITDNTMSMSFMCGEYPVTYEGTK
ncbi:MAG: hypothetical protein IJ464_03850 [Alistipes sp.]|nr:hypothetical protein [Alistipes sp.]